MNKNIFAFDPFTKWKSQMLDLRGCYTQEWSDKTGRDSAGLLLQQTFDYSEDPLKPRVSLIMDQTVTVLSVHPQVEGSIKMPSIWIENPLPWQENNSPFCWSRGSSFRFLNTHKFMELSCFCQLEGKRGSIYSCGIQEGTAKKKNQTYYANDNEWMNRCRKSQQIVSPDGTFPKHGKINCTHPSGNELTQRRAI